MSQDYYQQQWKDTQNALKRNLATEAALKKKRPIKDLNTAKWLVGHLFINYVQIVNNLDECYDKIIHPQKREVISRLLDMSLGRLLELKSEIVRIESDDYCFFDNILIELKLTHQDMEIQVPKYFWKNREESKNHRRQLIKQVFEEAEREKFRTEYLSNVPEEEREKAWENYLLKEEHLRLERERLEEQQRKMQTHEIKIKDSLEVLKEELKQTPEDKESIIEAIALIQRHERARQGRIRAVLAIQKQALKKAGYTSRKIPKEQAEEAAKVIQRHWRRHWKRVMEVKATKELQRILGMTELSYKDLTKYKTLENVGKIGKKMQERNQKEYEEALVKVKEKVTAMYSIPMEEDIVDEIMYWFRWFFEQSGYFPNYPPEKPVIPTEEIMGIPKKLGPNFAAKLYPQKNKKVAKPQKMSALQIALSGITAIGGSALVVAGHWIGPKEFVMCQMELEKLKKKAQDAKAEKKEPMSKEEKMEMKKKQKELERKRLLAEEAEGFRLKDSNYLTPLRKADMDYRMIWMDRDETKNPEQKYIYEFVKEEKCYELSMEVRATVDKMMELELDILKFALERDKNPKKKGKRKPKKPKKEKKEKKKKGKKDPTGHRTLDDLFIELYKNGIIREYEEVHLKDYFGERSFGAYDMREKLRDWPPSTGDVRELILQLCILPLGSSRIHQLSPLIKSICLLGTQNSGKEFLARIICTETASVLFDLSPENVVDKYPGKNGLKMLQHLIEKMSRALQPSIIFVDGAEKTFYKKVPKEEKDLEPKRLAPLISKIVKGIKPEDQVLLLGVSSQPWMAKKKKFLKTYQKTIQIPQMDYGSYQKLWQRILIPYHSVPRDFDVSCLAKVSDGYSVKTIMDAVENVLTIRRICRSQFEPYTQAEFLEELLKTKPTDKKLQQKSLKFYEGLELPKKRARKLKELREEIEAAQKKAKK